MANQGGWTAVGVVAVVVAGALFGWMVADEEAKKPKKREWTGKTPAFPGQIVGGGSPGLGKRS
jgi:hypothetical protein